MTPGRCLKGMGLDLRGLHEVGGHWYQMNNPALHRPHWSFWLIGVATLIFNCAGVANFVSQMDAESVAALPEMYRSLIEARPLWATGAFALAVFAGVIGCILLLLRKTIARYVLIASLIGAAITLVDTLGMDGDFAFTAGFVIGNLAQLAVSALIIWYEISAERKGWIE